MYERSVEKELLSSSTGGIMSLSPRKKAVARGLKSAGSALGVDEIDSECHTADGDHNMDT